MVFETLKFQASWREYQRRVLAELESHLDDNHLHIVAAPGSGKTILGLEVMRRIAQPTIILAPTITIRNQWVERLIFMFLPPEETRPDWISKNIRQPGVLTVITYQAVHAAFSGLEDSDAEIAPETENDSRAETATGSKKETIVTPKTKESNTKDIIALLKKQQIRTIILDEAHHLRKEWWKALSRLKDELEKPTLVSLTATPPYDVDFKEWQRYEALCGPIDTEISVPELVKHGDLCPHQDYVYFSLPTNSESGKLRQFKNDVGAFLETLKIDQKFLDAFAAHPWINDTQNHVEAILGEPKFFSSIIIYLNAVGVKTPRYALDILGAGESTVPELTLEWLEILLTAVLYTHNDHFPDHKEPLEKICKVLKRIGAIERRKVVIDNTKAVQKLLASSLGKLDSIVDITRMENNQLHDDLRMVILADYIRRVELPAHRNDLQPIDKIGVVPIFEYLRRANIEGIRLGVLTGSLIFIPKEAKTLLERAAKTMQIDPKHIRYSKVVHDDNYLYIRIKGEHRQQIVQLITHVFNHGGITVLIGTQALLGEGWDAPSINTLVLASYVGSYMLSNQMRGRAIRIDQNRPNKTANIWHLVAIDIESLEEKMRFYFTTISKRKRYFGPFEEIKQDLGNDLRVLCRRFRAFEGLSYNPPVVIENGIHRLGLSGINWDVLGTKRLNQLMLSRARAREKLPDLWNKALMGSKPKPQMRQTLISNNAPRAMVFMNTLKYMVINALLVGAYFGVQTFQHASRQGTFSVFVIFLVVLVIAVLAATPKLFKAFYLLARNGTLENSVKQVGWVVVDTLQHIELLKTKRNALRVQTFKDSSGIVHCQLDGATTIEKHRFLEAMQEVLGPTENQRYLLVRRSGIGRWGSTDYHPVPRIIGQKKIDAEFFNQRWERHIAPSKLVYTRSIAGRKTLLRARTKSLASAFIKKSSRLNTWT